MSSEFEREFSSNFSSNFSSGENNYLTPEEREAQEKKQLEQDPLGIKHLFKNGQFMMPGYQKKPIDPSKEKQTAQTQTDPIATLLQAIGEFLAGKTDVNKVNNQVHQFYLDFMAYMRPEGTPSKALQTYLYDLETSIGKQGGDPRLSHELELLKDYLQQLAQKYPYPQFMLGHYATQLYAYIATYQNRFGDPKAEKQMRGYRQVFVGQQSGRVLRIGYDATAGLHQVYLIDEAEDKVIEQMSAAAENQPMIQDLFVGQKLEIASIFNKITDWTRKPGIQGVVTPKESQIKGYKDVPFGIELAVSVLTPVGVMNSAYKLGTGKDLMHPEKKTISNWEKAFAVADLVLILPLGKILKVPGKIAMKLGKGSDEAATLLNTGKKVGDDFVVEVAQNSQYAEKFLKAEAKLAARQAKKAEAVKKADQAYQKYKDLQRAKYARKVAKGMDGVFYIKLYPNIHPDLATQAIKLFFAETQSKGLEFLVWLGKLKKDAALANLIKHAPDDELYGVFSVMGKIKQNPQLHQQMLQALQRNDKKLVEDLIANNSFKSGFGSAVLGFQKVAYSSSDDLVSKAIRYRLGLGKQVGAGSNVAVFEYVDLQGKLAYKVEMAVSNLGSTTGHAEQIIAKQLKAAGIPPQNVKRIYSELDSCIDCSSVLMKEFSHAKGYYSFELNTKGREMWQSKLQELYQYLFGN